MTPEQIAELREALAKATPGPWEVYPTGKGGAYLCEKTHHAVGDPEAPDTRIAELGETDARLVALMKSALPSLLDAAERCARLSEAIPFTVKGFAGELPAIDILENVATQLTTATRERDEMAKDRLEALKLAHSLTLETQTMPEAVTELVRLAHKARGERDAAIARAEAAEKERESLMARIEEVSGVTAAECPLSVEAALAALDKLDRMRPVVDAALLWHRGETQAEESRNDDGLRAAVAAYLDGAHAKGGG